MVDIVADGHSLTAAPDFDIGLGMIGNFVVLNRGLGIVLYQNSLPTTRTGKLPLCCSTKATRTWPVFPPSILLLRKVPTASSVNITFACRLPTARQPAVPSDAQNGPDDGCAESALPSMNTDARDCSRIPSTGHECILVRLI